MEDGYLTTMCSEGRHDLCPGYYGDSKGNYSCGCECHTARRRVTEAAWEVHRRCSDAQFDSGAGRLNSRMLHSENNHFRKEGGRLCERI